MKTTSLLAAAALVLAAASAAAWWALGDGGGDDPAAVPGTPGGTGGAPPVPPPVPAPDAAPDPPRVRLPPPAREPPIEDPGEFVAGRGATFPFAGYPGVAEVDWARVALVFRTTERKIRDAARRTLEGDMARGAGALARQSAIQMLQPAWEFARVLREEEREVDVDFELVYAHPVFESNAMAAVLAAWGRPLTDAQREALQPVWEAHLEVWRTSRGDTSGVTWQLPGIVAAAKSRDAVQARLEEVLTADQRAALWHPETKGRLGLDLFSSASVWQGRIAILGVRSESEVPARFTDWVLSATGTWDPRERAAAKVRVAAWLAKRPPAWTRGARGPLGREMCLSAAELAAALDGFPELVEEIRSLQEPAILQEPRSVHCRKIPLPLLLTD